MKSPMTRVRGILESFGMPVTMSLLEVCTTALETFMRRREMDNVISDEQLAREIANHIERNVGHKQACRIVMDNERLSAWRKPSNPGRPINPSVEDLCTEIVREKVYDVIVEYYRKQSIKPVT